MMSGRPIGSRSLKVAPLGVRDKWRILYSPRFFERTSVTHPQESPCVKVGEEMFRQGKPVMLGS